MRKILNHGSIKLYLYLFSALVLLAVWRGGDAIMGKLSSLEIKQMQVVHTENPELDTKSLYPVWVKQAVAIAAARQQQVELAGNASEPADMDSLFSKVEPPKPKEAPPKPIEPDYAAVVQQSVIVDAVMNNGAVINGQFYRLGEKLDQLAMTTLSGKTLVPVLVSAAKDRVTIRVGNKNTIVRYSAG